VSHHRLTRQLSAYLDGELPPLDEAEVRDHLARCDSCQKELRRLQAVRSALRRLPDPQAPADLWEEVRIRRSARTRAPAWWPGRPGRGVLAVAAATVVVLLALPLVRTRVDRLRAAGIGLDLFVREHALAASGDPFADRAYLGLLISDASAALAGAGREEERR
jgi:anti-sigma factor RsiW